MLRAPFSGFRSMNIEKNKVVTFHYTVFDADGSQVETSQGRDPLVILFGAGNIIPGLERALEGKTAGDRVDVTVAPSDAYGERDEGMIQRVPKKRFGEAKLVPGQTLMVQTEQGPRVLTVLKVGLSVVDVDLNHPMAGKTLRFEAEISGVRDANEEEIAHGHAHGPDGHAH
jgi:FKBP-type peptidyl-prolyl cis-trans isomerase SlyD